MNIEYNNNFTANLDENWIDLCQNISQELKLNIYTTIYKTQTWNRLVSTSSGSKGSGPLKQENVKYYKITYHHLIFYMSTNYKNINISC